MKHTSQRQIPGLGGDRARHAYTPALGSERTLERVLTILRDEQASPQDQEAAAQALSRLGEAAIPALLDLLHEPESYVRRAGARALALIRDKRSLKKLIRSAHWTYRTLTEESPGEAYSHLSDALLAGSVPTRVAVAVALGRLGERRAIPELLEVANMEHPLVRMAALHALGKLGDAGIRLHLSDALDDPDPAVRLVAAEALSAISR